MEDQNQKDIQRLRQSLQDLQSTHRLPPEAFGLYQQTILQVHQEAERRKITCFQQAETLRAQASAVESQGHAFSSIASILWAIVNGYVKLEEKRVQEEQERKERAAAESEETAPESPPVASAPEPKKKRKGNAGEASSD